jgi:hypothetical protein
MHRTHLISLRRVMLAILFGGLVSQAHAAFHLWSFKEIYSNSDGSVQFIEMFTTFNSQQFTSGQQLTTTANTFVFPANTPSPTANRHLLLATAGFAGIAGVTPNFTIPSNFFNPAADTITLVFGPSITFTNAPTDGFRSYSFPGPTVTNNSPTNFAGDQGFIPPRGDFNGDGMFNCTDVNALVAAIASGQNNLAFDLTGDGQVNGPDLTFWRAAAGTANLPSMNPYREGDANLDGVVDGSDFGIWNSNKFTSTAAWCSGDFNADGSVDGSDFGIWNANKFTASDAASALSDGISTVPEPMACLLIVTVILLSAAARKPTSNRKRA